MEGTIAAIHNMDGIANEAKAEEWLWEMVLQPLLLAVSKPVMTRLKASIVFGTVCRALDYAAAHTDLPLQQIWDRCLRILTRLPLLEVAEGFTLLQRCLHHSTTQPGLPQLELIISFCLQACEHPQSSPTLRCQAMTLIQQLAQAATVGLLERGSKAATLEAGKEAFSSYYTRLCIILKRLTQEREQHVLVRLGARKALLAVNRLFDVASPPENEWEMAASMTVTGGCAPVKIEEDTAEPPTLVEYEAAPLPDDEPTARKEASLEHSPAVRDSKPTSKSLLARFKSSKKGVKKAFKKVQYHPFMLPLLRCSLTCVAGWTAYWQVLLE